MASQTDPLQSRISALLDSYIATFNAGDLAAAAAFYDEPAAIITAASGTTVLRSHKDFVHAFTGTLDRLKADGWVSSEYVGPKSIVVLVEGETGLLVASCPCRRLRADGSSVEEFTAVYTLRGVGSGRWVICSIHHAGFRKVLRS